MACGTLLWGVDVRRWLVILIACQPETTDDETPEPPADTDTDTDPGPPTGTTDTSWWTDTGDTDIDTDTDTVPECVGLARAKVCGPLTVVAAPGGGGDSGDSGDSGGSGGGGTISCVSIIVQFSPNGVAKIDEADDTCAYTTTLADCVCVADNVVDIDGVTTVTWTPRSGLIGASLTSAIWPPLTEEACQL